jgi:hypothetical protein
MEFSSIYRKDDEIGAVNNLSPEGVLQAASLIRARKDILTRHYYKTRFARVWAAKLSDVHSPHLYRQ